MHWFFFLIRNQNKIKINLGRRFSPISLLPHITTIGGLGQVNDSSSFFFCFFSASFLKFYYFFFIKRVFNITSCYLHIRKIQKIPLIINISGQGPPFIRHTPRQYTSYPPNKYWIPNITSLLDFTFTWLTYKAKTTKL